MESELIREIYNSKYLRLKKSESTNKWLINATQIIVKKNETKTKAKPNNKNQSKN